MSIRTVIPASLLLFASAVASTAVGAAIYKCTDAQGATRYADKPCADNAVIITPTPAPAVSEESASRRDKTQRLLRAYEAEHEETQRSEAEEKATQERRSRNCALAKNHQRSVTQASRLYRTDAAGERFGLSDAERAATEAKASSDVAYWCDSK